MGQRLAAVFAHPDDESRIVGGTLALAASQGCEVHLYCATRGEAGDDQRTPKETAALREAELRTAVVALSVTGLWLDAFPDGALGEVAPAVVVERIVRFLRSTRPRAVITFGPDGRTGHPDHVAVGRLAEEAFDAAGQADRYPDQLREGLAVWQPGWLYHTAVAQSVAQRIGWPHPAVPDDELLAIDVSGVLGRKQHAAVEGHASQWKLSPLNLSGGWDAWSIEHFRLARTAERTGGDDPVADLNRE